MEGKRCTPISDGAVMYLTEKDHFVPDIVCAPEKIQNTGVYGAPDLVAEVLSPTASRNDCGRKMQTYARCGVLEYWIVSPGGRSVEQYFLQDGSLVLHDICQSYTADFLEVMKAEERAALVTEFRCSLFDDLSIRLDDVFYWVK